LLGGGHTP